MALSTQVETFKFWDVVSQWARERSEPEYLIAKVLVEAVVKGGLILNSENAQWLKPKDGKLEFRGYPLVGYSPIPGGELCILKEEVLRHMLDVVATGSEPSSNIIQDEFIHRDDFKKWLLFLGESLPRFWFND